MRLPPAERSIIPPANGWRADTYYWVEVSYSPGNPVHIALLYVGFVDDGEPDGYSYLINPSYEDDEVAQKYHDVKFHYLKALKGFKEPKVKEVA